MIVTNIKRGVVYILAWIELIYLNLFHDKSPLVARTLANKVWEKRLHDDFDGRESIENDPYYSSLFAFMAHHEVVWVNR